MQIAVLRNLLRDFRTAISSEQNDEMLDASIGRLRGTLADPAFLAPFSIYSRAYLRDMDVLLAQISTARLNDSPLGVACAVDAILKLFERLEVTVKQTAESDKRIQARRSG